MPQGMFIGTKQPWRMYQELSYVTKFDYLMDAGEQSRFFTFRGNSPRDPRWTTGTTQDSAMWWEQFTATEDVSPYSMQYKYYRCLGSRIDYVLSKNGFSIDTEFYENNVRCAGMVSAGLEPLEGTTLRSYDELRAGSRGRWKKSPASLDRGWTMKFTDKCLTRQLFNATQMVNRSWTPVGNDEPDLWVWNIGCFRPNKVDTATDIGYSIEVEITYFIDFMGPRELHAYENIVHLTTLQDNDPIVQGGLAGADHYIAPELDAAYDSDQANIIYSADV